MNRKDQLRLILKLRREGRHDEARILQKKIVDSLRKHDRAEKRYKLITHEKPDNTATSGVDRSGRGYLIMDRKNMSRLSDYVEVPRTQWGQLKPGVELRFRSAMSGKIILGGKLVSLSDRNRKERKFTVLQFGKPRKYLWDMLSHAWKKYGSDAGDEFKKMRSEMYRLKKVIVNLSDQLRRKS